MGVKDDEAKVGKVYKTESGANKLLERLPSGGYGIEAAEGGYTVKKLINDVNPRPADVTIPIKKTEAVVERTELPKPKKLLNPDSYDPNGEFLKQRDVDKIVVSTRASADVKVHNFGKELPRITRDEVTKANADVKTGSPAGANSVKSVNENAEYEKYMREKNATEQAKESVKNGNAATERLKSEARADDMKAALDDGKIHKREDLYKDVSEPNYKKKIDIGLNILNNESPKQDYSAEKNPNAPKTMDDIISETKHNMPLDPDATMKNSGVFSEDASKYNLKNVAELEAKVGIEEARISGAQVEGTSLFKAAVDKVGGLFKAKSLTKLVDNEYDIESPLFKDGRIKGNNNPVNETDVNKMSQLGQVKDTLKNAKENIMKEMYEPAKDGSSVHFEKGLEQKLNKMDIMEGQSLFSEDSKNYEHLNGLGINKDTKLNWQKTESGALEATYKNVIEATADSEKITEHRKLQVNFGEDGAISGIDALKKNGDSWEKTDLDSIKIEGRGYVNPEKASEIASKTTKEMRKEILSGDEYKDTSKWNLLKRVSNNGKATEEAERMIDSAKQGLKSHNEALGKMKENIGKTLGDAGRVDMKAIEKAASGTIENVAKDTKNISAMANNSGKGMKSLLLLGAVAAGLGAVKSGFDNSAEQRRQKQLELMSLRQQYGGASM